MRGNSLFDPALDKGADPLRAAIDRVNGNEVKGLFRVAEGIGRRSEYVSLIPSI
jgi:hypothetical protein